MAKKASTDKKTRVTSKNLRDEVLRYISQQGNNTFNYKQVSYAIGADSASAQRPLQI